MIEQQLSETIQACNETHQRPRSTLRIVRRQMVVLANKAKALEEGMHNKGLKLLPKKRRMWPPSVPLSNQDSMAFKVRQATYNVYVDQSKSVLKLIEGKLSFEQA